jgi:hypothetical protein
MRFWRWFVKSRCQVPVVRLVAVIAEMVSTVTLREVSWNTNGARIWLTDPLSSSLGSSFAS